MTTEQPMTSGRLLVVDDLKVGFGTEEGIVQAVDGVSFAVDRGETSTSGGTAVYPLQV